jgi:hypothetical protein
LVPHTGPGPASAVTSLTCEPLGPTPTQPATHSTAIRRASRRRASTRAKDSATQGPAATDSRPLLSSLQAEPSAPDLELGHVDKALVSSILFAFVLTASSYGSPQDPRPEQARGAPIAGLQRRRAA